ncbi:MAG: hypothetical protein ACXWC9_01765 [Pseudobdellovibrionaceae bacterium]
MKYAFLVLSVFVLGACNHKSEDRKTESVDPIYGQWTYLNPASTSSKIKGMAASVMPDGSILILNMYILPSDSATAAVAFRKSVGTFSRSGDLFTLNYSYETCKPIGTEVLTVKVDPGNSNRILVATQDGSVFFTMNRAEPSDTNYSLTGVEDKNCDILANLQKTIRMPASVKSVLEYSVAK